MLRFLIIGSHTLKGKDGTVIDFMCLTMINPASSWFEIAELPVVDQSTTGRSAYDKTEEKDAYFDKSSTMISTFVNKTWFSRYLCCQHIIYNNGSEFKLHFEALYESYGLEWVHQVIMSML